MTTQQLRDYIVRKLGGSETIIELTSEHISDAIEDGLGLYNRYICNAIPYALKNQTGSVVIQLKENENGILWLKTTNAEDLRTYAQMNIFELMHRMIFPRLPIGDWYMMRSFYEMYQKIRGTDPDWYIDQSTKKLYIDCISGPYDIFYIVAADHTVESLSSLKRSYFQDFKDLCVANAKITLSRVRGKFGGSIPVPGGAMNTDAAELKAEGEAKILEIEARLDQLARFTTSPIQWF